MPDTNTFNLRTTISLMSILTSSLESSYILLFFAFPGVDDILDTRNCD